MPIPSAVASVIRDSVSQLLDWSEETHECPTIASACHTVLGAGDSFGFATDDTTQPARTLCLYARCLVEENSEIVVLKKKKKKKGRHEHRVAAWPNAVD